jgi:hypothetical protein
LRSVIVSIIYRSGNIGAVIPYYGICSKFIDHVSVISSIRYCFSIIIYLLFNFSNSFDLEKQDITGKFLFYFQYFRPASKVVGP